MKKNWQVKKLGDVCEIHLGKTPSRGNVKYWDKARTDKNVWLSIADLNNLENGYIFDSKEYVTHFAVENAGMRKVSTGTLLLSFKLTIGRTAFAGKDLYTNEAIAALPLKEKFYTQILPAYLRHYFAFFDWDKYAESDLKIKGKTLNKEKLKIVPIPVPPLAEQWRIVALLDSVFEKIAVMKRNAETNLQNAKDLFSKSLNEAMTPNADWKTSKLGSLCSKIGSGATPKGGQASYKSTGVSLIRSMNVNYHKFKYDGLAYLDDDQATKLDNVTIQPKDVLINITGASIARCCVVPDDVIPARVNQHVSILRTKADKICCDFLSYYLITQSSQNILLGIGEAGSTRQALTKTQLEEFAISFPDDKKQQRRIVQRLDALSVYCQELQANYTRIIADCDELKKSILSRAFSGEL